MAFFHPELDVSPTYLFKVVCDSQLLEKEEGPSSDNLVISPHKDAQVEPEGDKIEIVHQETTHL